VFDRPNKPPRFVFFNFFFILRYFLRFFGSFLPPTSIKNIFYSLSGITIGKRVFIGESVYFIDGFTDDLVVLEDEAVLSPKVVIVPMAVPGGSFLQNKFRVAKIGRVVIKKGAWLGAGCVILPGVTIGEGSIIGANAVVVSDVPAYQIWSGNPAKFTKNVSDYGECDNE
jgi:acetyltransferase-like isoleucine patch superfamily enzyme